MELEPVVRIVEDDPQVSQALAQLVAVMGLEPAVFESSDAFLAAYTPGAPGCLIVDVRMRGMSGIELLRELAITGKSLPTIVITGHGDAQLVAEAGELGAVAFLHKPFPPAQLREAIERAVSSTGEPGNPGGRNVRRSSRPAPAGDLR